MTTIKAIETQYKGYRFRSRLEARWAVFFDALGVKWEYEPQGFDLSTASRNTISEYRRHRDLHRRWSDIQDIDERVEFEQKNDMCWDFYTEWNNGEIEWLNSFKGWYLPDFYLPCLNRYIEIKPYLGESFWGSPEHSPIRLLGGLLVHGMPGERDEYEVCTFEDVSHWFGYCPTCKTFGQGFYAWAERICPNYEKCGHGRKTSLDKTAPFRQAIMTVRSARFEHGEKPFSTVNR